MAAQNELAEIMKGIRHKVVLSVDSRLGFHFSHSKELLITSELDHPIKLSALPYAKQ